MRLEPGHVFAGATYIYGRTGSLLLEAGVSVPDGEWADSPADFASDTGPKGPFPSSRTAESPASRSAIEIPDDWRDLSWQAARSLAAKLTDAPVKNRDDVVWAIEAELERRAGE